jgi:hypothetical protein
MSRAASTVKKTDIKRVIEGAEMAGKKVASVEVKPDGTIIVHLGNPPRPVPPKPLLVF